MSVQEKCIYHIIAHDFDIKVRFHPEHFDDARLKPYQVIGALIPIKLHSAELDDFHGIMDFFRIGIDEHPDLRNEIRKPGGDFPRPQGGDVTVTGLIENETKGIGFTAHGVQRILQIRDAAYFDKMILLHFNPAVIPESPAGDRLLSPIPLRREWHQIRHPEEPSRLPSGEYHSRSLRLHHRGATV